jgi:hypothetical protein
VVLKEGKLDFSSGKDIIQIAADEPSMIYVAIELYAHLAREPEVKAGNRDEPVHARCVRIQGAWLRYLRIRSVKA